jgi:hypothetical protein
MRPTRRQGGPRHPKRGHACIAPPMSGASRVRPVSGTAPRPWIDWTLIVGPRPRLLGERRGDRPQLCCPASPEIERTPAKGPQFCPPPLLTAISLCLLVCLRTPASVQLYFVSPRMAPAVNGTFRAMPHVLRAASRRIAWRTRKQARSRRAAHNAASIKRVHVSRLIRCVSCLACPMRERKC